jgi:hypothetical protein
MVKTLIQKSRETVPIMKAGLWIRTDLIWIRIRIQFRVQGIDDQKLREKNYR